MKRSMMALAAVGVETRKSASRNALLGGMSRLKAVSTVANLVDEVPSLGWSHRIERETLPDLVVSLADRTLRSSLSRFDLDRCLVFPRNSPDLLGCWMQKWVVRLKTSIPATMYWLKTMISALVVKTTMTELVGGSEMSALGWLQKQEFATVDDGVILVARWASFRLSRLGNRG